MKIIGFNFTSKDFRYAILEGDISNPRFVSKEKMVYPQSMDIPELMEWLETELNLIIDHYRPDKVGYRISLSLSKIAQIRTAYYAQAILNLSCSKKNTVVSCFSPQSINGTKIGCNYSPFLS